MLREEEDSKILLNLSAKLKANKQTIQQVQSEEEIIVFCKFCLYIDEKRAERWSGED